MAPRLYIPHFATPGSFVSKSAALAALVLASTVEIAHGGDLPLTVS